MLRQWKFAVLLLLVVGARESIAQTTFISDTFTAASNTLLESHTPNTGGAWTRQTGNGIIINAASDDARSVSSKDWSIYTNATVPPGGATDVVVGADVTFTNPSPNNFIELIGRGSVALADGYIAQVSDRFVTLSRVVGGTITLLDFAAVNLTENTAHRVIFSIKNSSKEVWIDGVAVATSTDNTVTASGLVGLAMYSNNVGQETIDNFAASTFAPTAVDRVDASATRDGSRTLIEWRTARETSTLGFRVYRQAGRHRIPLPGGIVAGSAFMTADGALPGGNTYRAIDEGAQAAHYWIEELDLHGASTWYGPIDPHSGSIDVRFRASAPLARLGAPLWSAAAMPPLSSRATAMPSRSRGMASAVMSGGMAAAVQTSRARTVDPLGTAERKQWELAASSAIRIAVSEENIHRVTRAELLAAGLDPNADPASYSLYAGGREVPIIIDGQDILFYGIPLDTQSSGTRVYWLTTTGGSGARIATSTSASAEASAKRSFRDVAERRDKTIFFAALRNGDNDSFFGPAVSTDASSPTQQIFPLQHVDSAGDASLTVSLQGASADQHRVAVTINGYAAGELTFSDQEATSNTFAIPAGKLVDGDNVVALTALNGDADVSLVASVSIAYEHLFVADDGRLLAAVDGGRQTTITGFATNDIELVDVTDPWSPIRIQPSRIDAGAVTFTAPGTGTRRVLAIERNRFASSASITQNTPSSLHTISHPDYVVIAHPSLVPALEPLIALRRAEGLSVVVATTEDIYDEFNYGAKSAESIRTFLFRASPRYVLLLGDASFDPRDYLGFGDFDLVPTKLVMADLLKTASDAWLADFDDDGAPDIPIGRLPARTLDDARIEIGKVVAYEQAATHPKEVTFITDADASIDFRSETAQLEQSVPPANPVSEINVASAGAAAARLQLSSAFADSAVLNYVGHGSTEVWSNSAIFTRDDALALTNDTHLPIVLAVTCLNGAFHDVYTESMAEALLRAPNGGAAAVWASSALTSPEAQVPVTQTLLRNLFTTERLGDAVTAALRSSATPDIRRTFLLFGDPAMRVR